MGSHSLSMWFWLRGTSRREDRFASTHPLAPSSEKTTTAPISLGTRGQLPRPYRASGRITLASSNPHVGCSGECEGRSKPVGREPLGLWPQQEVEGCGSRTRRGVLASWLHGWLHGSLLSEERASISYWSGGQSAPSPRTVNLQCGCRVKLVFTQTCFQVSIFSCLMAPHFCDYQHHPLPVRHRFQHKELHSSPRLAVGDREMIASSARDDASLHHLQEKNCALA